MFVLADSNPAHVAYSVEIFPLKAARIFVGHCGFPKVNDEKKPNKTSKCREP